MNHQRTEAVVGPLEELLRGHFDGVTITHLRLHWHAHAFWGVELCGPEALGEGPHLAACLKCAIEAKRERSLEDALADAEAAAEVRIAAKTLSKEDLAKLVEKAASDPEIQARWDEDEPDPFEEEEEPDRRLISEIMATLPEKCPKCQSATFIDRQQPNAVVRYFDCHSFVSSAGTWNYQCVGLTAHDVEYILFENRLLWAVIKRIKAAEAGTFTAALGPSRPSSDGLAELRENMEGWDT